MSASITVFDHNSINDTVNNIGNHEVKTGSGQPLRIKSVDSAGYQPADSNTGFKAEKSEIQT